ncbi:MAG: hypothetical protein PHE55_02280 [Methylococcaceae bacterium]|nr:hypothetical protein [Methylococcaceae bacterium]
MKTHDSSPYVTHNEVWPLLPWYVNGSLETEKLAMVKAHLRICLICRKEASAQETLANILKHESILEISAKPSFDRLMARIQAEKPPARQPKRRFAPASIMEAGWLASLPKLMTPPRLALACGLSAIALVLVGQDTPSGFGQNYHTVANPGSLDTFAANDLRVIFNPESPKQPIARLLESLHARIVDGPSAKGVYTVRIEAGDFGPALSRALETLREHEAVVFAEPALPRTNR